MASERVTPSPGIVEVQLCVPEEQRRWVPRRRLAPDFLPVNAPVPSRGDVVYLSNTSAWMVQMVIHQWRATNYLRVEVWLDHVNPGITSRPTGFGLTQ